ncbi:MAG: OpgC domain-containing protein [Geminicoccaceae bacterium]
MNRITLLDGLRGFFVVFMLMNHLTFSGGYFLGWLNYAHLSFVQSAQGFILVSGLLVGLVYMKVYDRSGPDQARRRLWRRAAQLYGWHIGVLLAIVLLSRLVPGSWNAWGPWLDRLYGNGVGPAVATATLLYQPMYMDILPQYIVYLLVSPAVLWLIATGRTWLVAALSISAWLLVQLGVHLPLVESADAAYAAGYSEIALHAHFNPLGWQVLFMAGVVAGALMARGEFDPERLVSPDRTDLLRISLFVLGFFLCWRMAFHLDLVQGAVFDRFVVMERRGEFGPVYLLSSLAAGYALLWLFVAGPRSAHERTRRIAEGCRAFLGHPFLMLLGRNALPVYAFHVFVVYVLKLVDTKYGPFGDPWSSLLGLGAIAILALPALLIEWLNRRPDRATGGSATPVPVPASRRR